MRNPCYSHLVSMCRRPRGRTLHSTPEGQGWIRFMLVSSRRRLSRAKLLRLVSELESGGGAGTSLYIPPGALVPEIESMLDIAVGAEEVLPNVARAVAHSTTGAVLFWGDEHRYLVLPPFPVIDEVLFSGYDVEPLRSLLQREFILALILVRLGAYAIGVFQGERLVSSKVGTGHIHSRHKKGGSSQRRIERGREKQILYFFDRVCTRARERLEPYVGQLDYVVYGGERHTLLSFRKRCGFLKRFDDRTLGSLLDIREPRQVTLESAIGEAWSSVVIQWKGN